MMLSLLLRTLDAQRNVELYNNLDEVPPARGGGYQHQVLVLGPSQAHESTLERVGELVRTNPACGALLVVSVPNTTVLRFALRAGLDDAVPLERISDDLEPAIRQAERRLRTDTAEIREAARTAHEAARGRIAAVFSPKGGVGRSVVAVNLAVSIAAKTRRKVVLVDVEPQFGDVCVMLRLRPVHTIIDAINAGDRIDPSLLESLLTHDERSGVSVLAAPTDPTTPAELTPKAVSIVLEVLKEMGALVVIDTPRHLDDVVLQVLGDSDDIVYLVGMDVPSVKNARLGLQALELVQIPITRVVVVLNRADSRVQLSPRDVEKVLEMRLDASLPSDPLVPKSINRAVPVVFEHSKFANEINAVADILLSRASSES
jgi:pilus assembly protein CpaE